jgi:hypothetical protein
LFLPPGKVGSGRVAADGSVGHRSAVRCCSLTVARIGDPCESPVRFILPRIRQTRRHPGGS